MAMTLPTDAGKRHYVERMFDRIALRYDLMNRVMTLGIDRSWRARAIDAIEPCRGDVVIDLGCGTGDLARAAAARGARSLGVDVAAGMLEQARARDRATLLVRADGLALPLADASCDAAGFENVCKRRLTGGVAQLVTARRMPRVGDEKGRGHGV